MTPGVLLHARSQLTRAFAAQGECGAVRQRHALRAGGRKTGARVVELTSPRVSQAAGPVIAVVARTVEMDG